jgi:carbon-monoxide dehydrogenase medium subunit
MFPRPFDYSSPRTLAEALDLLKGGDAETKVLAGGQSLIPAMKLRNLALKHVVDIGNIKELNYLKKEEGKLKIGATTITSTIEYNSELAASLPVLTEAASQIADPLVRNLGTVGGDLCYGDPANDFPAPMIALNASFTLASQQGTRTLPADAFFVDTFKTVIKPNELLTEIQIPLKDCKTGNAYQKIRKGSGGFTIAGVAVNLAVDDDNAVSSGRIALTAVAPTPLLALKASDKLTGKVVNASVLKEVADLAVEESKAASDITASAEYRRKVLALLVVDAVEAAYRRAVMGKYVKS